MSGILKQTSADGGRVRGLFVARQPAEAAPPSAMEMECDTLRREVEALRSALQKAREQGEAAAREAYARGRERGLTDAGDMAATRLETLQSSLSEIQTSWSAKLDMLDGLSALLARTALSRMFSDAASQAGLVEAMIARQFRTMRANSILAVSVSPDDFGDDDAIARLQPDLDENCRIAIDSRLPAGSVRLDLELGHLDLSLSARWGEVAALLGEMAEARD